MMQKFTVCMSLISLLTMVFTCSANNIQVSKIKAIEQHVSVPQFDNSLENAVLVDIATINNFYQDPTASRVIAADIKLVDASTNDTLTNNKMLMETQQKHLIEQAKQKVNVFATQLKAELVGAIQSDGLAAGVDVCHSRAPEIASTLSNDGWTVARTSLRTRNKENAADQWESDTLVDFDSRFKQGEDAAGLVAVLSDEQAFRFMKAIPMDKVCLACHGSTIDPKVLRSIQIHYPNDSATGFSIEDIRGAFTLEKDLSE